jgi:hypothetical protein
MLLAVPLTGAVLLAACGSSKKSSSTTTAAAPTTSAAAAETTTSAAETTTSAGATTTTSGGSGLDTSLASVCPSTVVIQTDWNPEAEHGNLYELVGPNPSIDSGKKTVTGELTLEGKDTGVKVQVRSGGPAIGFQQVTSQMYQDPNILLGFVYTDEGIQNSKDHPTVALVAPFYKNPQMIFWDPATYPDVKTIADLGAKNVKIQYFSGATYMDWLIGAGIVKKGNTDGSYDGTPANFVAAGGKIASQGFGSAEPYIYQHEVSQWDKPVAYSYIDDAGYKIYAQSLATLPGNVTKYSDCFKKLIPIIQQSTVDYVNDPTAANALILQLVKAYNNGWVYSQGVADYAVATMKKDGLIANSPTGALGDFDLARVDKVISQDAPIFAAAGKPIKDGLKASDIVSNQFIDTNIHL